MQNKIRRLKAKGIIIDEISNGTLSAINDLYPH